MDAASSPRLIFNLSPEWNESKEFEVHLPELAMLEIIVLDHDHHGKDDKIGFNYLPDRLKILIILITYSRYKNKLLNFLISFE